MSRFWYAATKIYLGLFLMLLALWLACRHYS